MFIPRHSVVENQFCKYAAQTATGSAGVGGVVAYAGSVVYLNPTAVNQEAEVIKMSHTAAAEVPFGFIMQKVKTGYHQVHPAGYAMPGDLGSSDAIAQPTYSSAGVITGTKEVPVGVAHLGIWDTVHYTCTMAAGVVQTAMTPGLALFAAADEAKVTNSTANSDGTTDVTTGARCTGNTTVVARVVKGASVAKCQANIDNTVMYPIRIKLLI
jgi:hypothetical protein